MRMNHKMSQSSVPSPQSSRSAWPEGLVYRAWQMRTVRGMLIFGVLCFVWLLGGWCANIGDELEHEPGAAGGMANDEAGDPVLYWTCSMHPQIKLPKSGQCPICFMDLVPVQAGGAIDAGAAVLTLSPRARELARVQTSPVELRELTHEVRMVGKVMADETLITHISSYVPGRIERLFVNYTGILVRKGDHLAEIYSPELLIAQREYVLALEASGQTDRTGDTADMLAGLQESARRKLELWGVPRDQIDSLTQHRRPSDHTRIDAPQEGWVLERQGFEGMYVETGTRLFTLVDLRSVWVLLDAYELDLGYARVGQEVQFETEAHPGQVFSGRVAYVDPLLSANTRTVKVRMNVPNPEMKLRPEMFVRARLSVKLGRGGAVLDNTLAGKWVCYMHPEIVKETQGACDVCDMKLVTAESLGYAVAAAPAGPALAVPQTAVLLTGRRAVVYVEKQEGGQVVYEGREIGLGPRAGDYFIVQEGLSEGERVVTRGALMIDSAMQIQAKPSMMQPPAASTKPDQDTPASRSAGPRAELGSSYVAGAPYHQHAAPMIKAYLELTAALARDDLDPASLGLQRMREALKQAIPHGVQDEDADLFRSGIAALVGSLPTAERPTIDDLRSRLPELTESLVHFLRTFGHDRPAPIVRAFCPMARNSRGAEWLQEGEQIANPYFGAAMLRCGEIRGRINADGSEVKR